jgi:hypothetical protein
MATFLEICQDVYSALGLQGSFSDVNASNDTKIIAQSVRDAWEDIQLYRTDWKFLQAETTLSLVTSRDEYDTTFIFGSSDNDFGHWDTRNFIYDYESLEELHYDRWRRLEQNTANKPIRFTVRPSDNTLLFNPLDTSYDVDLSYYKTPQILENNTDVPILPQAYHQLLMYKGLINASVWFSSGEMYQYSTVRADQLMGRLMREQLPSKRVQNRPLV